MIKVFGFIHKNYYIKQVMGLIDKIIRNDQPKIDQNQLNIQELQLVLSLLRQSSVRGDQVEAFYNLVIKLQNQYFALTPEQK